MGAFINNVTQILTFYDPPAPIVMLLCPKPYLLASQKDQHPLTSLSDVIYECSLNVFSGIKLNCFHDESKQKI